MKDLPKRALTAIIFGTVMLGGLLWNRISFSILILIIQTGCLYEYLLLVRRFQHYPGNRRQIAFIISLAAASTPLLVIVLAQLNFISFAYGIFLLPLCLVILSTELFYQSETPLINGLLNAGAVIYISLPLLCFYSLMDESLSIKIESWYRYYASVPVGIVLLIWANDTFAYFTGSLFGRHKILPAISPKKSWEGFFGGLIFSLITAWIISLRLSKLDLQHWLMVALLVTVFGTLGDFFESMIKRQAGVKDSGTILPGHGGFLDRFDALIFCVPFVWVYLMFTS